MPRCRAELLCLLLCACDVEGRIGFALDPNTLTTGWAPLAFQLPGDVDLLFVVDNSAQMAPKQRALAAALGGFAEMLGRLQRHFHVGVVTTDLGAGRAAGECVVPGDNGLLLERGRAAPEGCLGPVDARWIDVDGAGHDNLPAGQTLGQTLGCLVQVGDRGCGYPQPLEAARRALTNNQGFARPGSLLLIVFVTDGDDCSAPSDATVFDLGRLGCLQAGVECGDPPHPPDGVGLADCRPRQGGGLYDLSRYRDYLFDLTRRDPNAVGLVLLAGPASPVSVSGGEVVPSCVADPGWSALPAVRLQALAQSTPRNVVANLCAPGAAEYALGSVVIDLLATDPGAACLPAPIANSAQPRCEVAADGIPILGCNTTGGAVPCWELEAQPICLPIWNPRERKTEQLGMHLRGGVSGEITARCQVILPRN